MRFNASIFLPTFLLLAGCGGVAMGSVEDDPQLPVAPQRPVEAVYAAAPSDEAPPAESLTSHPAPMNPGASYAAPAANASAEAGPAKTPDLPDEANSYRTADGVVHLLPRGRREAAQPSAAARTAPVARSAPDPVRPQSTPSSVEGGPPPAEGPQATSQPGVAQQGGEERFDTVGYAGVRGVAGNNSATANAIVAVHPTLPAGTIVEVTSLDTGHTILVLVTATMAVPPDHVIDLSTGAARLLGGDAGGTLAVRVRKVLATPQDQNLLRSGQSASERIDAPAPLVSALRRRLGSPVASQMPLTPTPVSLPPSRPAVTGPGASYAVPGRAAAVRPRAPTPPPALVSRRAPVPAASSGYFLQVAALSASDRAQAVARSLGGSVRATGNLYKVQVGPYASAGEAERAKSQLSARGYGGAMIVRLP